MQLRVELSHFLRRALTAVNHCEQGDDRCSGLFLCVARFDEREIGFVVGHSLPLRAAVDPVELEFQLVPALLWLKS